MSPLDQALAAIEADVGTGPIMVACSGGGDSLALTLAAHARWPGRVRAVHVDHGLRATSAAAADQVRVWLAARAIPVSIERWQGEKPSGNIQAAARAARYALLTGACVQAGAATLLLAHTQEDVVESLVLRLTRGAGLAGLAAMAAQRTLTPSVRLIRPFLALKRAQLRDFLRDQGQGWLEDPANVDPRFDRARTRAMLKQAGLDVDAWGQSAQALRSAETALDWAVQRELRTHMRACASGALIGPAPAQWREWPLEIALRVLRAVLMCLQPDRTERVRGTALLAAVAHLRAGEAFTLSGVQGEAGVFMLEPGRLVPQSVPVGEVRIWGRWRLTTTLPQMQVRALGEKGWGALPPHARALGQAWPHSARLALPALWQQDRLLCVPALGWGACAAVEIRLSPLPWNY